MWPLPVFECGALYDALDERRDRGGMGWYDLADELWQQSSALNAIRPDDHPLCGGAVQRLQHHEKTSCQYALFMLRWLDAAPEDFLTGPVVDVGDVGLPDAGDGHRLRSGPRRAARRAQRAQAGGRAHLGPARPGARL